MSRTDMFVKTAILNWQLQLTFFNTILEKLSDEQLMSELAPGRNRGIYLLGHLTAVHDLMLPLLRFDQSMYPELQAVFIDLPDKELTNLPSIAQLKQQWNTVNETLLHHFTNLPIEDWLARHANISEEDFANEPHRNRFSVLLSRMSHLSHHRGQLILLIKNG